MKWFTGDQHFAHEDIIWMTNRPFTSATKMERVIIARYRDVVKENDIVYFLGDLTLKGPQNKGYLEYIVSQLPGRKILILGNHDKFDPFTYIQVGFESVHTSLEVPPYILNHDPAAAIIKPDALWLCCHVHTLFRSIKNVLNVGVDQWEFYPVSEEEVAKRKDF